MSTSASTQTILTVVKDEFAEVLTKETLSPTTKPANWNVIITKKALLDAMKTPSPPPELIWRGLVTLYDNTFPTLEDYWEFTVNRLVMWGNTMDYKLFNSFYVNHRNHTCTIKKLWEQAMALLEKANKINDRDLMIWQEIENHIKVITKAKLCQHIKKPQRVRVMVSPTLLPSTSWQLDNFSSSNLWTKLCSTPISVFWMQRLHSFQMGLSLLQMLNL
jgi:hypothetical protein